VGISANATYTGVVSAAHPDSSEGGGTIVPPSNFGPYKFSTPDLPNSVASVTLNLTGYWHFTDDQGTIEQTTAAEPLTVERPPGCVDTRPGSITIVKTTSGTAAPAG